MAMLKPNYYHVPQKRITAELSWLCVPCGVQDAHYAMVQGKAEEARRKMLPWRGLFHWGRRWRTILYFSPLRRDRAQVSLAKWLVHEKRRTTRAQQVAAAAAQAMDEHIQRMELQAWERFQASHEQLSDPEYAL